MEYVNDAQGKTVAVASTGAAPAVQPAAVSVNAPIDTTSVVAATVAPSATPAAVITVKGLSTLEEMKDAYEREVARVEADAAAVKAFAASVLKSGKADVVKVEADIKADVAAVYAMPRSTKMAVLAGVFSSFGLGVLFDTLLHRFL